MTQTSKKSSFHVTRLSLFGLLVAAFFIVRLDAGQLPVGASPKPEVLAYASEMSREGLLAGTNSARASNGLGGLALNGQLNAAAQAKAEHMAANDYWAHVAPDGTDPWYFFDQAGYPYIRAGENLAYGFSTSQGAVTGWMNSPSHRDNMLGDYVDVGFGIVNVPNYQGNGQQTVVVAHYGKVAGASAPAPVTPAAPAAPAPAPNTPTAPASSEPASPPPSDTAAAPSDDVVVAKPEQPVERASETSGPIKTGETAQVTMLGNLSRLNLSLSAWVGLALVAFACAGYAFTHYAAFRHSVMAGEHFVVKHPGIDTAAIGAVAALILFTTYGSIA